MSSSQTPRLVSIGAVVRSHGVRGLVRVRPFDDRSEALAAAARIFLIDEKGRSEAFAVERATRDNEGWLVGLKGIVDRDVADGLRGRRVALPREELPEPADDELYVEDLVGCALVDLEGKALGTVRAVENYGSQELLMVTTESGEAMVPFVEPIVVSVDLEARRIVCDPPEGLFDPELR